MLGTLGAAAFNKTMRTMSLEFPMLTMAKQMELNLTASSESVNCTSFYVDNSLLDEESA